METLQPDPEHVMGKLLKILSVVELDFECLSCNQVRPDFLSELKDRLKSKFVSTFRGFRDENGQMYRTKDPQHGSFQSIPFNMNNKLPDIS